MTHPAFTLPKPTFTNSILQYIWTVKGFLLSFNMPSNKHAIIRHIALDKCFRNTGRKFFMDDLVEACCIALENYSGIDGVRERTVRDDITFMESSDGYSIQLVRKREGRRVYYRYEDPSFSIHKKALSDEEAAKLKETLMTLSRFKGLPQFAWVNEMIARLETAFNLNNIDSTIIEFDQNPLLRGLEYIDPLFHAITEKKTISLAYKGIKMEKMVEYNFSPHFLKQYNTRWFVLGQVEDNDNVTNFALDRIESIHSSDYGFIALTTDYSLYFKDVIGVTVEKSLVQSIEIAVKPALLPYISTKPIHASQSIVSDGNSHILTLKLIPNYELESLLLSYGEGLKVIAPEAFRQRISSRIKKMFEENY